MSEDVEHKRPPFDSWQVESIRLTAFPAPKAAFNLTEWPTWQAVFHKAPTNSVSKDHGREIKEDGPFGDNWLSVIRTLARIDWILHAKLEIPVFAPFTTIGSFVKNTPAFQETMCDWLAVAPSVNRLAFGTVLNLPVENRNEGYHVVSSFLPFAVDPVTSRDFVYQINRPRMLSAVGFETEGILINRLSKWAVAIKTGGQLQMDLTGKPPVFVREREAFSCRLELDINTDAAIQTELPRDSYVALFSQMVKMAQEIAESGDIK